MSYIFDTSCFRVLKNYYPSRFPTIWTGIDSLVEAGKLISVREVFNEIEVYEGDDLIKSWSKDHKHIFLVPTDEEQLFVKKIFEIPHFQHLISQKNILAGKPVADPFVIASAKVRSGCVVTQEQKKEHGAKIPNICEHFGIECITLEGFMTREGWSF